MTRYLAQENRTREAGSIQERRIRGIGEAAEWPHHTRALRILLAEDSPDTRVLITVYLRRLPYKIEAVENGKAAVEKFTRRGAYDLVLMDMQMPVMDGCTATRIIRAWEIENHARPTPILALTASTLDEDVRRAFEAGCSAHIVKPVRKPRLLATIDEALVSCAAVSEQQSLVRKPDAAPVALSDGRPSPASATKPLPEAGAGARLMRRARLATRRHLRSADPSRLSAPRRLPTLLI